jgi:hypothetical protein
MGVSVGAGVAVGAGVGEVHAVTNRLKASTRASRIWMCLFFIFKLLLGDLGT